MAYRAESIENIEILYEASVKILTNLFSCYNLNNKWITLAMKIKALVLFFITNSIV